MHSRRRAVRGKLQVWSEPICTDHLLSRNITFDECCTETQMAALLPLTTKDEKTGTTYSGYRIHAAFYVAYVNP